MSKCKRKSGRKKYLSASTCKQMVLRAIKCLKNENGSDFKSIFRYIQKCYNVKKNFPLKQVIDWLVQKQVLCRNHKRIWIKKQQKSLKKCPKLKRKRKRRRETCKPQRRSTCSLRRSKPKKLKFRDMIINAIRAQKKASCSSIELYISRCYKVCNSFVIGQTLKWLQSKGVIECRRGCYSLTGKPLTLYVGCCEADTKNVRRKKRAPKNC